MEELIAEISVHISNTKTAFMICAVFIFGDIFTGYLKAFKFRKVNSSVSRDGYIKKVGWVIALLIGWIVDILIGTNIFLIGSAIMCVATEGISFYENLGEIGVKTKFRKYFEKLKDTKEGE